MHVQGFHPLIAAPLQAQAQASSASTGTNSTSGSSSSGNTNDPTSASGLQSTFLNLLVTELQNQDPTQPVDPTEMVSQMVSLNQLDQLISINQSLATLTGEAASVGSTPPTTPTGTSGGSGSNGGSGDPGVSTGTMSNQSSVHALSAAQPAATAFQQSPLSMGALPPAAWMNLYGNAGAPANYTNHFSAPGGR